MCSLVEHILCYLVFKKISSLFQGAKVPFLVCNTFRVIREQKTTRCAFNHTTQKKFSGFLRLPILPSRNNRPNLPSLPNLPANPYIFY